MTKQLQYKDLPQIQRLGRYDAAFIERISQTLRKTKNVTPQFAAKMSDEAIRKVLSAVMNMPKTRLELRVAALEKEMNPNQRTLNERTQPSKGVGPSFPNNNVVQDKSQNISKYEDYADCYKSALSEMMLNPNDARAYCSQQFPNVDPNDLTAKSGMVLSASLVSKVNILSEIGDDNALPIAPVIAPIKSAAITTKQATIDEIPAFVLASMPEVRNDLGLPSHRESRALKQASINTDDKVPNWLYIQDHLFQGLS